MQGDLRNLEGRLVKLGWSYKGGGGGEGSRGERREEGGPILLPQAMAKQLDGGENCGRHPQLAMSIGGVGWP